MKTEFFRRTNTKDVLVHGQLIQIKWEGPFTKENLPLLMCDKKDSGIYQVYSGEWIC